MKTTRKNYLYLLSLLVVAMITVVSCGKDDDTTPTPAADLKITSISPDSGGEGTEVNINGTGFSTLAAENTVTLSGKSCPVLISTATLVKVKIPADAATGKITVTVGGKSVEGPLFTFIPAGPTLAIESIEPATGPKGTEVVITGTAFSATKESNIVTINDKAVTVKSATTTKLTVVIPANAGSGKIKVAVADKSAESAEFAYIYTTQVITFAGSESGYLEGVGTAAKFNGPYKVAVDASGNVYVVDTSNHRIRKIAPDGTTSILAGSGTSGDVDGTGEEAQFQYPYGIALGPDGNLYVTDTHNHKLKKVTLDGVVTTIAGSTGGYQDGTGAEAQFRYLTGVAFNPDGDMIVSDKDNNKLRKVTTDGVVTTFAGGDSGYKDGTGTDAQFASPFNVAFDANGDLYVADASNHKIRKVTSEGVVTTVAGNSQGFADGTGTAAQFNYPYDVAIDADGNLFVADTFNQRVRMITLADGVVTTYAGTAGQEKPEDWAGNEDGTTAEARFKYLTGITIAPDGKIYIADKDNHRIRIIYTD